MTCQPEVTSIAGVFHTFPVATTFTCALQVLVVDHPAGPANILADTISRLLGTQISVTSVDEHMDALRAITDCGFDVVLVGVDGTDPFQLTVLPYIRAQDANLPVLVIGNNLSAQHQQHARRYGARNVLTLPKRAADLKAFVAQLMDDFLQAA
jgi:DNA-binding NtrC family response regulator